MLLTKLLTEQALMNHSRTARKEPFPVLFFVLSWLRRSTALGSKRGLKVSTVIGRRYQEAKIPAPTPDHAESCEAGTRRA
jgi:hypothetical protein